MWKVILMCLFLLGCSDTINQGCDGMLIDVIDDLTQFIDCAEHNRNTSYNNRCIQYELYLVESFIEYRVECLGIDGPIHPPHPPHPSLSE